MAQYFDLTQTGPELQERIDQVFPNRDEIALLNAIKASKVDLSKIWEKLEDMTGESYLGITMTVTPQYYIGEEGATVHITANTVETGGIFERIKFFANGTLIAEAENVEYFEEDVTIDETTVIMCKAQIMGAEYTRQEIVTHYNSYWLGCGADYQAVMINDNLKPITEGMRANYDVTCAQGDHIIIILGETLRHGFIRADMNSFEIPFNETTVTVDGNTYAVLTSANTYQAGTYNIDING